MRAWARTALNLKWRWFLIFAVAALILTTVVSVVLTQFASNQIRQQVGNSLAEVAYHLSDKLDRGMFERYRDMQVAASLTSRLRLDRDEQELQQLLNNLQTTYSDYAWIGLTDAKGNVLVATGDLLEGMNVSMRPWFQGALAAPYVGDVHSALLLEEKLTTDADAGAPLRFVDVAVPIRNEAGTVIGVLGAHLNWRWARELERSVLAGLRNRTDIDVIVTSGNNYVVLGPDNLLEKPLQSDALAAMEARRTGFLLEASVADNSETFLVGYSRGDGYRDYRGLDWKVLVRQPTDSAFQPVAEFRNNVLLVSIFIVVACAIIGWVSAGRMSRPLLRLTEAARNLSERTDTDNAPRQIPTQREYPEVRDLSVALNTLIQRVDDKQRQLSQLNEDLDDTVKVRTQEVLRANEDLKREIEERRKIQREREKLIGELERLATTDSLTKLGNRRSFFEHGEKLLKRNLRLQQPATLIMFDIDHFKRFNDTYGHAAGDEVLRQVGQAVQATQRGSDVNGRTGGEEFALLLDATDVDGAQQFAERLRKALRELRFENIDSDAGITVSLGIALWDGETSLEALLNRADKAMYEAKQKGRDRVEVAPIDKAE